MTDNDGALRRNMKSDYLHLIGRCNALLEGAPLGYIEAGQARGTVKNANIVVSELTETCTDPDRLAKMREFYMVLSNLILKLERKHTWGWHSS